MNHVAAVSFADYLTAKFALDERSFNRDVRREWAACLPSQGELRCLDLGTGQGAMLLRVMDQCSALPSLHLTALDHRRDLLELARQLLGSLLQDLGYRLRVEENLLRATRGPRAITIEFVCAGLADFAPETADYDLITAHAFMDLVPLADTVASLGQWLKPSGLFYATLNYDGGTTVFPVYGDEGFEAGLLAAYDASMDERRTGGTMSGGSRSGSRLHAALLDAGWEVCAYGSSDWNIAPLRGAYRDQDALCLSAMLDFIRGKGMARLDPGAVESWYQARHKQLADRNLGMIVHQIDLLAQVPADSTESR